jgi:hypothetical protein
MSGTPHRRIQFDGKTRQRKKQSKEPINVGCCFVFSLRLVQALNSIQ